MVWKFGKRTIKNIFEFPTFLSCKHGNWTKNGAGKLKKYMYYNEFIISFFNFRNCHIQDQFFSLLATNFVNDFPTMEWKVIARKWYIQNILFSWNWNHFFSSKFQLFYLYIWKINWDLVRTGLLSFTMLFLVCVIQPQYLVHYWLTNFLANTSEFGNICK